MITVHQGDLITLAEALLEWNPQPVPYYRLLRDVLGLLSEDYRLAEARQSLLEQKHILELAETQLENGTWGRFHTQDTSVIQRFVTTEAAIERALALGLDKDTDILRRTEDFIIRHLSGQAAWSDRPEKHDTPTLWDYGTKIISAANLALIDPFHPLLAETSAHLVEMARITFRSGKYNAQDEVLARKMLAGIDSKSLPGFLLSKYCLILLSIPNTQLPQELEEILLQHLLHKPDGIYYTYHKCLLDDPRIDAAHFTGWLSAQELLSRFRGWTHLAPGAVEGILRQRIESGFWDFGQKTWKSNYFPLSEDWRRPRDRVIDCTVRILMLL